MADIKDVLDKAKNLWPKMNADDKNWVIQASGRNFAPLEYCVDDDNVQYISNVLDNIASSIEARTGKKPR